MAQKNKMVYICAMCGYESLKWYGCCPGCGEWNCMNEEARVPVSKAKPYSAGGKRPEIIKINDISSTPSDIRHKTGLSELDRVLGGGIVKGSVVLFSGDPGIGKSTLLLQICDFLGKDLQILYVSGEESAFQIKLRADRLGVKTGNLSLLCETDVQSVCEFIKDNKTELVIIDSIQTMHIPEIPSSPGSVTQVREATSLLMRTAKDSDIPVFIVGHVNKDGNIAGPKVLEHIVDTVLYLEGEKNLAYRILRAIKNRYGSTNEIGVFEMLDQGLSQVENPSLMLISGRPSNTSGTCVACVMEGSRPLLAEVQGLVTPTGFGNPRRMSAGFDYNRMSMLIAVMEKRGSYFFGNMDTYVNIVGGLKLEEPATDLPVALALISSLKDKPVPDDVLAFGEIGLAGEIRAVTNCEKRVKEAARLGFKRCVIPYHNIKHLSLPIKKSIEVIGAAGIREAYNALAE